MFASKIFPGILILLDLASAGIYAVGSDWKHTVYWLAAATLTASVTF